MKKYLLPVILILFLLSPPLAFRLNPNGYTGGRSRDARDRSLRNSSSVARMLGEVRTSMSDVIFIKTERYMHMGVGYVQKVEEELESVSGTVEETAI